MNTWMTGATTGGILTQGEEFLAWMEAWDCTLDSFDPDPPGDIEEMGIADFEELVDAPM